MIDPKLAGKVALVTGANHGIGAATARGLADQGAKVFVSYHIAQAQHTKAQREDARRSGIGGPLLYEALQQQPPDSLIESIRSGGGIVEAEECDLGDPAKIPSLFGACEQRLGPVDILVVNHTHCAPETFDPTSVRHPDSANTFPVALSNAESIDRHFAVNSRAAALMMKEFLARHVARDATSGRIITLTTTTRHARNISYAASKAAIVSYTLSSAEEMGRYGITANVVCPGPTQTGYIAPEDEGDIVAKTPLGRLGLPEDVADVILFLASEQAHWLTGQLIYASGGFSMHLTE